MMTGRRAGVLAVILLLALLAGCVAAPAEGEASPLAEASAEMPAPPYADTLFDDSLVHSIDIQVSQEAWDAFILTCSNKEYISVDLVIDGERFPNAAIRGKGNSSLQKARQTGKYSFKVEFDHFTDATFRGLDKLSLNNLVSDASCMRDYIVYRLMGEFGVPAPLCSYVFVTVNGADWGFYLAVEGIEDSFLERNFGSEHGALYKPDNLNNGGAGNMRGGGNRGDDVKLKYIDGDPASYPNIFGSAKTDITRKDQYRLIESLRKLGELEDIPAVVDIEEMLRYLTVHSFVSNGDSYTGSSVHNYYLYESEGRLSMLPWDYNEAFGDFGNGNMASAVNDPIDSPVTSGEMDERPMVAWMFSDPAYAAQYHATYLEFLDRFCRSGWITETLTETAALIDPYIQRDPRSFCAYDAFTAAAEQLVTFFELRAQSVLGQLSGSIPSTSEGQAADSAALIDASELGSSGGASGGFGGMMPRPSSGEASGVPADGGS